MSRTDLVTVYLPTPVFGVDAVFEAEINIRPLPDQACPGNVAGIVADVFVEALHGERQLSADQGQAVLRRIKDELPWAVWAEIVAKADENHLDGAAPARAA